MKIQALARGYLCRKRPHGPSASTTKVNKESRKDIDVHPQVNPKQDHKTLAKNVNKSKTPSAADPEPVSIKDKIKDLQRRSLANPKPFWNTSAKRVTPKSLHNPNKATNKSTAVAKETSIKQDPKPTKQQDESTSILRTSSVDSADTPVKARTNSVDTIASGKAEAANTSRPPLSPMMAGNRSRNNTWKARR